MPTLTFLQDGVSIPITVDNKQEIFHILNDQGLNPPRGCLAGVCSVCVVEIHSGMENISRPDPVEHNTLQALKEEFPNKQLRLACRAKLLGDATVSIPERVSEKNEEEGQAFT